MGRRKKARNAKDLKLKQPYTREPIPDAIIGAAQSIHRGYLLRLKRQELYSYLSSLNRGFVSCFVCGEHVTWSESSLEHIKPTSKGGTDDWDNLAISHELCNYARGDDWRDEREEKPRNLI